MKAKLFLFYLRYRKPIIFCSAAIALVSVVSNFWLEYRARFAPHPSWQVVDVESGDRLTVAHEERTKTIQLCGISASGEEAKDYLRSLIERGDGTVEIERVGKENLSEAWVLLKPDFEQQIHLNTWIVQHGMGKVDPTTSDKCLQKENLIWAEKIAQEDKLGIWKN